MEILMTCPLCGETHSVVVDFDEFCAWQSGELIQVAMPNLTPTKREQLISEWCPECQKKIFG